MAQANEDRHRLSAVLARKVEQGADAGQVAASITEALSAIAARLTPIIGKGGVVALYRRSLHLIAPAHPWLTSSDSARNEIDLAALGSMLAQQGTAGAAEAGGLLLQTFCDLLASLVGNSLTDRLLRTVWADL